MFPRPPFPWQGHHMHFFKHTVKSLSISGLCSALERHRQRLSMSKLPVLSRHRPLHSLSLGSGPGTWALLTTAAICQHLTWTFLYLLPHTSPGKSSAVRRSNVKATHYPPPLLSKSIFLLGWEISCSRFMQCLVHQKFAGSTTKADVTQKCA